MSDHPSYSDSEEESGHVQSSVPSSVIWRYTGILAAVSLVLNLILYFIGTTADWIPDDMPASTEAFSLVSVVLASVIPVVLFGALMVYLANNAPRASRLFTMILLVVLIIAVMVPFTIRDIDTSFQLTLVSMHLVTAGSIFVLTQLPSN